MQHHETPPAIEVETNPSGTVLIVDDEPDVVEMYADMLGDDHTVHTVTSGEAAVERLSEAIDVVLLDRRMPGLSGDTVLEHIREAGFDCRVAMVTAVQPDTEIFDMPFDDYLVKPVRRQELREVVEGLLLRTEYSRSVQESMALTAKLITLRNESEVESSETIEQLHRRRDELSSINQALVDALVDRDQADRLWDDLPRNWQESRVG